jgi:hypothetical protein
VRFLALTFALVLASPAAAAPRVLVDDFEDASGWSAHPADGVELAIGQDEGVHGKALRLDFRFVRGGGYAVARKAFDVPLPADYRFHLAVRGATGPQNFEFKLIDSTGANVWWNNRRDFDFPTAWDSLSTKKRKIEFAWGPIGGGTLGRIAAIEFAITAGSGGQGTVWLDDLTLEPLPPPIIPPPAPRVTRTARAVTVDLGTDRELSALFVTWPAGSRPGDYVVELSDDGSLWRPVREVRGGDGGLDPIHLPDAEARAVRVRALAAVPATRRSAWAGARLEVHAADWAPGINDFFARLAARAAPGLYPRGIAGEQPYWTAIGADRDAAEALVDEDGRIEPWKQGPSLEAFVRVGGKVRTWRDGTTTQALVDGDLPLPVVTWTADSLRLTTTTFVAGDSGSAGLLALYQLENLGRRPAKGTLALALRPFQVNPPPQFLNTTGGAARVSRLALTADRLKVDARPPLLLVARPHRSGVAAYDQGDVIADFLARGRSPSSKQVHDPFGHASALLEYDFDLRGGEMKEVSIVTAMDSSAAGLRTAQLPFDDALHATAAAWRSRRGALSIELPPAGREALETFRAQLAWLRITRDGPALKPGTRSYDRSWIRDGALSSAAMLRAGEPEIAREFATWFSRFVPEDGAVPCCVDHRGPDPTPEHDSHGEFVFLVAEILRYTGDTGLAERLWPAAERAASHIDALRRTRQGPEWRTPETAHFYGLLPPSISHEGYSAKPMHSYWDDFFALRGLTDAAWLAGRLGHAAAATRFAASRDSFAADFAASIRASMALHKIPYVPGSADLGDYDATSTTIALDPVAAGPSVVAPAALGETFDGYWKWFERRRDGKETWDAYTPYELRTIGALVRLGQRDRANEALDWFLRDRRPAGFRHWAEVVSREDRKPRFLGDMPHTWVGTDYVRSFLDLFAYPLAGPGGDSTLVVAAGLRDAWVAGEGGVRVRHLPTPHGTLSYRLGSDGADLVLEVEEGSAIPSGGIRVALPQAAAGRPPATLDGAPWGPDERGHFVIRRAPARAVFPR